MQKKILRIIVDHAHLSKLRPLTVYCIGKGNLSKVYSYDIIIPKQYKVEEVSASIIENVKLSESNFIEKEKEHNVSELLEKLKEFEQRKDQQETTDTYSDKVEMTEADKIDEHMNLILSHPLVYSDLAALVMDLRAKIMYSIKEEI